MAMTGKLTKEVLENVDDILGGKDPEKFVDLTERLGKDCRNKGVSTSQIRAVFSRVQNLPNDYERAERSLQLLRPKLAYQQGRHSELSELQEVLDEMIQRVSTDGQLKNFKQFFEAVLAYHKAHGGD